MLAELGPNQSVSVLDRDTNIGGVLNRKDLSQSLKQVKWTTKLRDGRVPTIFETAPSGKHKLGFWKAEEYGLNRIYRLTFSHTLRVDGWTKEHNTLLRNCYGNMPLC
jgi:hypothetical protein